MADARTAEVLPFEAVAAQEMSSILNCTVQLRPTVVRGVDSSQNYSTHRLIYGYRSMRAFVHQQPRMTQRQAAG